MGPTCTWSVADTEGRMRGANLCHGSRVHTTMELLLICPEGWTMGRGGMPPPATWS